VQATCLICPPDVAVFVLLMLALYDLHLVLYGLFMKDWADEIGHKPDKNTSHYIYGNGKQNVNLYYILVTRQFE
jgi:hypothetical protein